MELNSVAGPEAVFFDFDGTLADSGECSVLATQAAFTASGLSVPEASTIRRVMGVPIEQSFRELGAAQFSNRDFAFLLQKFRSEYKRFESVTLKPYPGITELVAGLRSASIKLAIVSSKSTVTLARNCALLNLTALFDLLIGSDNVAHYKPDPEGVFKAMEFHSLATASRVLVVGDSPLDIAMAKNAGAVSGAAMWGTSSPTSLVNSKPDITFNRPDEITKFVLRAAKPDGS